MLSSFFDTLAEWLRRRPAKPMGSSRVGSNPIGVVLRVMHVTVTVCSISVWIVVANSGVSTLHKYRLQGSLYSPRVDAALLARC